MATQPTVNTDGAKIDSKAETSSRYRLQSFQLRKSGSPLPAKPQRTVVLNLNLTGGTELSFRSRLNTVCIALCSFRRIFSIGGAEVRDGSRLSQSCLVSSVWPKGHSKTVPK
jgi:hypothetical protein